MKPDENSHVLVTQREQKMAYYLFFLRRCWVQKTFFRGKGYLHRSVRLIRHYTKPIVSHGPKDGDLTKTVYQVYIYLRSSIFVVASTRAQNLTAVAKIFSQPKPKAHPLLVRPIALPTTAHPFDRPTFLPPTVHASDHPAGRPSHRPTDRPTNQSTDRSTD